MAVSNKRYYPALDGKKVVAQFGMDPDTTTLVILSGDVAEIEHKGDNTYSVFKIWLGQAGGGHTTIRLSNIPIQEERTELTRILWWEDKTVGWKY